MSGLSTSAPRLLRTDFCADLQRTLQNDTFLADLAVEAQASPDRTVTRVHLARRSIVASCSLGGLVVHPGQCGDAAHSVGRAACHATLQALWTGAHACFGTALSLVGFIALGCGSLCLARVLRVRVSKWNMACPRDSLCLCQFRHAVVAQIALRA